MATNSTLFYLETTNGEWVELGEVEDISFTTNYDGNEVDVNYNLDTVEISLVIPMTSGYQDDFNAVDLAEMHLGVVEAERIIRNASRSA